MLSAQQTKQIKWLEYGVASFTLIFSTTGLALAVKQSLQGNAHRFDLILLGSMSLLTGLGITIGFHRYFTHRSFETHRAMQVIFGLLGSMAMQGPLYFWATYHRKHHRYADKVEDVHSPLRTGGNFQRFLGFAHAHFVWLLSHPIENRKHYIADLLNDPLARRIDRCYPICLSLGLLLPALIGRWYYQVPVGYLQGFIWGGLARVALVHHITWCVNSFGHCLGHRDYETPDNSRNNFLVGIITLGEGWHNNHHAFPRSARHGLCWQQIDISYWVICLLEKGGLVSAVIRQPPINPPRLWEREKSTNGP